MNNITAPDNYYEDFLINQIEERDTMSNHYCSDCGKDIDTISNHEHCEVHKDLKV